MNKPSEPADAPRGKASLRLWLRMLSSANLVEQQIRSRLRADFNVTLPQFDVLSELQRVDMPQTMSELSRTLLVSNGNITGVVDRLERDGLVRRQPAPNDRRVQLIALTVKGRGLFDDIARVHEQWVAELFTTLSLAQIEQITEQLGELKRAVTP